MPCNVLRTKTFRKDDIVKEIAETYKQNLLQISSFAQLTDKVSMLLILIYCQKLNHVAAFLKLGQQINLSCNLPQHLAPGLRSPFLCENFDCNLQEHVLLDKIEPHMPQHAVHL